MLLCISLIFFLDVSMLKNKAGKFNLHHSFVTTWRQTSSLERNRIFIEISEDTQTLHYTVITSKVVLAVSLPSQSPRGSWPAWRPLSRPPWAASDCSPDLRWTWRTSSTSSVRGLPAGATSWAAAPGSDIKYKKLTVLSCPVSRQDKSDKSLRCHLLRFEDALHFVQICSETHQKISVDQLVQNQLYQGAVSKDSLQATSHY